MLIKEKKHVPRQAHNNQTTTTDDVEKAIHSHGEIQEEQKQHCQQEEQQSSTPSFFQSLHVFKNPQFLSLTMAELAASIGYLIPLYYMQSKSSSFQSPLELVGVKTIL